MHTLITRLKVNSRVSERVLTPKPHRGKKQAQAILSPKGYSSGITRFIK